MFLKLNQDMLPVTIIFTVLASIYEAKVNLLRLAKSAQGSESYII